MDDIIATDKQIEQILRQITVIPEQAADGIAVADLAGTIRFVNPAWAAMHGYNHHNELVGKHISVFHSKEQMKNLVAGFIEETKHRGQLAGPVEHIRSDGTVFRSHTKMTTAKDKEGKTIGLIVFATNTTEHSQSQACLREQTTELTAASQQLQQQIAELKHAESELKEQRNQLEQRLNEQSAELSAIKEQLQLEIAKHKQIEEGLRQQTTELTAANKQIQQINTKYTQAEKCLSDQSSQLAAIQKQLQQEIASRRQAEENLSSLQAKLNNIHSITRKYL